MNVVFFLYIYIYIYIYSANTLRKGVNPTTLLLSMGK